jgi:hypothetical protein
LCLLFLYDFCHSPKKLTAVSPFRQQQQFQKKLRDEVKDKNSKAGHIICKMAGPSDAPFILLTKDQAVEVMTQPTGNLNFNSKMFSPRQGEELR